MTDEKKKLLEAQRVIAILQHKRYVFYKWFIKTNQATPYI